ncbi:Flavastacin [Thalassocella blandensis]|nr:Flavastacin [Thalassocella blandensis]
MKKNLPALLLLTSISTLTGFTQADVAKVNAEAMQGQTPKTSVYTPDNSEIEYLVLNDTAIIMGDIAVGSQQEIQSKGISTLEVKDFDQLNTLSDELTAKAAWAGATTWPNSVVPFVIDASSQPDAAVIRAGMDLIASQTGVRFVQRNNQTNYLRIFKGQGCWSFIGRKGGQQNLSIGPGCAWKKTVAHELMHALGFLHEQSRADRDNFVRINYNNIQDGRAGQFNKKGPITTSVGSYDYHSVMHYGHKAFSKNGKPTIVSLDPNIPNQQLGKSNGLTNKDIAAIRNKYGSGNASPLTAFENCDFTGWSAKIPEGHHNLKFLKTKGFVNDQMSHLKLHLDGEFACIKMWDGAETTLKL